MSGRNYNSVPDMEQLSKFRVNRENAYEGVRQTLYDSAAYANAGQTSLQFFQVPKGQGGKTAADTNMESAGSLPSPKKFLVESVELLFFPGIDIGTQPAAIAETEFANDVYAFAKGGFLDFFVGSKSYLTEAPLGVFPGKTRLNVDSAHAVMRTLAIAADTEDQVSADYACMAGRPYYLAPPLLLEPTQNFNVTLNWPAVVALPSGVDGRVVVKLDGVLYRLSQ